MRVWVADEGWVVLDERSFVAHGGQGRVWARGGRAYKVHDDPTAVVPAGKLAELARIVDPGVIRPLAPIEGEDRRAVIGHTMKLVERAVPWAQLIPRPSRARLGIDPPRALELVLRLRERVAGLHALAITVVDLHAFNVLVDVRTREPYLIDLDSAQTPGFPATAALAQIVDLESPPGVFGPGTDWFAFAITSFELLCGIHPYRGTHPRVHGLEARMRARLSVLAREVRVPPACTPPHELPRSWQTWFRAVLEEGVREPPPATAGGRRRAPASGDMPEGACGRVAAPDGSGTWLLVHDADGAVVLVDPRRGARHPLGVAVDDVRVDDGRVLGRCGDRWVEIALQGHGHAPWASLRVLARIAPRASALWPGCATQTLLGSTHLHVRTATGCARSIELPELAGMRVLDAAADLDTAALLASDGAACHRLQLRWDPHGAIAERTLVRDVVSAVALRPRPCAAAAAVGSTPPKGPQLGH